MLTTKVLKEQSSLKKNHRQTQIISSKTTWRPEHKIRRRCSGAHIVKLKIQEIIQHTSNSAKQVYGQSGSRRLYSLLVGRERKPNQYAVLLYFDNKKQLHNHT